MFRNLKATILFSLSISLSFLFFQNTIKAQTPSPSWASYVSQKVNLGSETAGGMYISDINNDDYPDIITLRKGWHQNAPNMLHTYVNLQDTASNDPKDRMFVDITDSANMNGMPNPNDTSEGVIAVAFADINNDGNVDMVRGNFYYYDPMLNNGDRCEVFLGDGKGQFTLVANNGLHDLGLVNTMGFSFLDYNKDGNIDLYIACFFYNGNTQTKQAGRLMKGNGDGTFTDVSTQAGVTKPELMYGVSVIDWNNDGWPDIATAPYCRDGGQLWKNNGDGTFTDVAGQVNYNSQEKGGDNGQNLCMWIAAPEDFDNDGDMDFFIALVHGGNDFGEGHSTIVMNSGAANDYKLSWDLNRITWKSPKSSHRGDYDASWLDWDNDGLMDLVMAQGNYMPATDRLYVLHQKTDNSFMDVTQDMGLITTTPESHDLHLLEVMDYDLDGDDDLIFCRNGKPQNLELVENKIGQDNNWIGVKLKAPVNVNKSSIGARIFVWTNGVKRMREVYAGRGNQSGQQPFAMLFGLGQNTKVDSVKVRWTDKDNSYTVVNNPTINKYIEIGPNVDGIDPHLGIPKNELAQKDIDLKLYPNPAHDFVLVQLTDNVVPEQVEIYNTLGQKMNQVKVYKNGMATWYCGIKELSAGTYILKITDNKQRTFTETFLKK